MQRRLLIFAVITIVLLPTLVVLAQNPGHASFVFPVGRIVNTVAFGDSNTLDFAPGITNWYERLATQLVVNPIRTRSNSQTVSYRFTLNNQSVGAKSVAPTLLNGQNAQYDINAALSNVRYADMGFVMLGTNDAYRGVTVTAFVASYQALISTVKASGKVVRLEILSVPPMIPPYNCISGCYHFPNNPQVARDVPFNQQLATISTYCSTIGYQCDFINSSAQIPLNTTFIDTGTGIHLLNPAQAVIADSIYNALHAIRIPGAQP